MTIKKPATLLGLAIGDALGMPFEDYRDRIDPRLASWDGRSYVAGEWKGRVSHNLTSNVEMPYLPPGHWTDDTEMAIALAESMLQRGYYDAKDAAMAYLQWARGTPHGMGTATRDAMRRLDLGLSWEKSGTCFEKREQVGNGTAMRIAPLGVYYRKSEHLLHVVGQDARITHDHDEAVAAAYVIACLVADAADDKAPLMEDSVSRLLRSGLNEPDGTPLGRVRASDVLGWLWTVPKWVKENASPSEVFDAIGRRGNAVQTVATAVYCAMKFQNDFVGGVEAAIRGGGDTDTRGAITGAILGARLGRDAIPKSLIAGLKDAERIMEIDDALALGPRSAR